MRPLGRISRINATAEGTIEIPIAFYHRVALGLETGTTVHVAPVLPQKPEHAFVEELIVTTFKPEWWQNMFRLSIRMAERHGAVADALLKIKEHEGNIAVLENVTTEAGAEGTHHVLAFVHLPRERLDGLLSELKPLAKDDNPDNLKHEPLQRLRDCYDHLELTQPYRVVVQGKKITIPATIFRSLVCPRGSGQRVLPTRTLIFSDSEEKFLQCYFPRETDILMVTTVNHREHRGAIHSFSNAVSGTGANILGSFSRLESAGDTAEWKAVIDVTKVKGPVSGIISKIAEQSDFFYHFSDVTLSFLETPGGRNLTLPPSPSAETTDTFIGRTGQVQEILSGLLTNRTNYIVKGFTKAGKTVLLYRLRQLLEGGEHGSAVRPVYIELHGPDVTRFWEIVCLRTAEPSRPSESGGASPRADFPLVSSRAAPGSPVDWYEAFQAVLERSNRPLVVLVDEAQYLLHPTDDQRAAANQILRQIAGLKVAQHASGAISTVAWVLADRDAWKQDHLLEPGMRGKFTEIPLHPLTPQEGADIATTIFKKATLVSDHLEEVHRRIAAACGNQPYFIQMVTRRLLQFVNLAPEAVDIVDASLIERAIRQTVREDLRSHFEDTARSLKSVCRPPALRRLLSTGHREQRRLPVSALLEKGHRPEDLAIFPGLVLVPETTTEKPGVMLVELMQYWLDSRNSVDLVHP